MLLIHTINCLRLFCAYLEDTTGAIDELQVLCIAFFVQREGRPVSWAFECLELQQELNPISAVPDVLMVMSGRCDRFLGFVLTNEKIQWNELQLHASS